MNTIEIIKKIAINLSDYEWIMKVMKSPENKQMYNEKEIPVYDEVTLSHGLPAICLLFSELSNKFPEEEWDIKAHELLIRLKDDIECGKVRDLSMFSGYAGIGLCIESLSKNGTRYERFIKGINEIISETFEKYIEDLYKAKFCFMRDYDIISGVSGILSYTLNQNELGRINEEIKNYLIFRCQDISLEKESVPGFYIPMENQFLEEDKKVFKNGNFNLGMAHGIPGILVSLCKIYSRKREDKIEKAIRKCADFLVRFLDETEVRWGAYVSFEAYCEGKIKSVVTRDAWCYGTPGVSYALYIAGRSTKEERYKDIAIRAMLSVTKNLQGIYSPTFCHGFAGVAYIFLRFYQMTNIKEFQIFAEFLKNEIWKYYNQTYPVGFRNIEHLQSTDQIGLLSGVSGILLVLLAFEDIHKTRWDAAFQLDAFDGLDKGNAIML